MTEFAFRRAAGIGWQVLDINKDARARQKLQKPVLPLVNRFTGRGQVDDCEPARKTAVCFRQTHLHS